MESIESHDARNSLSSEGSNFYPCAEHNLSIFKEIDDNFNKFCIIIDNLINNLNLIDNNIIIILNDLKDRNVNFTYDYVDKILRFIANKPECVFLEHAHKQIIFYLLSLYTCAYPSRQILLSFLENVGAWILDPIAHAFLYRLAAISDTRFPDSEVLGLIRDSKIGAQGMTSPHETALPNIMSFVSPRGKLHTINIENTNFFRRVNDLKINITSEEEITIDIIVFMICSGIPAIRNIALKKILFLLNHMRLVKMVSQLISIIIYNLDLENILLDNETVKILMTLKVKTNFENLINNILYCFFLHYPEQINYFIKLLLNLTIESNMSLITRMVNITRLLFNSNIELAMGFLIDLWYSCDEKHEIYISNCFKESEYSHLILNFFTFLFESYDYRLPLPVFLIRSSRTIITLILDAYLKCIERVKNMPVLLSSSNQQMVDEKLLLILYNIRIIYLTFMNNIINNKINNNLNNDSNMNNNDSQITLAFCEGLLIITFLKPISYYLFNSTFNDSNIKFLKNHIKFFILSDNSVNFIIKMVDFLYNYPDIFQNNVTKILELFTNLLNLLINYSDDLKDNILNFVNVLISNDFITKLFDICSSGISSSEERIADFSHFENFICICLKLFILNSNIVSAVIFEKYISIKYMLLKIAIPKINVRNYVNFEKAVLVDDFSQSNFSNSDNKNFILDLNKSIIECKINDIFAEFTKDSKILDILSECSCFSSFLERVWFYSLASASSDPYEIYKYVSFLPDFVNYKTLSSISKIPKIILLAYLTLNYFRSFFQEDKSIGQAIIEHLLKCEDSQVLIYLQSMFEFSIVSSPSVILFFLLSSKIYTQKDYLVDGLHLDSYTIEPKFIEIMPSISNAVFTALKNEVSTTITINLLKMIKIIHDPQTNIILSEWIVSNHKMLNILLSKYNVFDLINEIFKEYTHLQNNEKYTFSILLLLSLVPSNMHNQNYKLLRNNILNQPNLNFTTEFIEKTPEFVYIAKSSDDNIINFFVIRAIYSKDFNFQLKFLFRCLQCSYHSLTSSLYFLDKISPIFVKYQCSITPEKRMEYENIVRRAIQIHKDNSFNFSIPIVMNIINMDTEMVENNNNEIYIEKISNALVQHVILSKESVKEKQNVTSAIKIDNSLVSGIENTKLMDDIETDSHTETNNLYSKISRLIKENPLEAVFLIGNCTSDISQLISYRELVDFLIDISELYDDSLISFSGDILKVIRCLISHPQLYLNQRQVTLSYGVIEKYLSLGDKFYLLLCQCLIYEASQESEDPIYKLNKDYYLWVHVLNKVPIDIIENYIYKYTSFTFPLSESKYSVQCLIIFLHLNYPTIFEYKLEFQPSSLSGYVHIYSRVEKTILDEFILRIIQNSFEFITIDNPSIASSLRFLYFCKIFKLYPLLIYRHLSFFLSCLSSSLKTLSFLKSNKNRTRIECVSVFYDIFITSISNELSEENQAQASKINQLFELILDTDINMSINVYNIDYLLISFSHLDEDDYVFKIPEISTSEIAYWLINHPIREICELKKQLYTLGNNLNQFYRIETSKMTFIKLLLPVVIIVPQFWQNHIVENILMSETPFDNDDILNLLTKHQELFSIFEDYFNSNSYRL